jgi:formylglycine-generating enzyme required for sulfatase activity
MGYSMVTIHDMPDPSAQPRMHDHIFISYAHEDRAFVGRMAHALRSLGHTVWIDFEGILGGDIWRQAIVDGIYASAIVMVALSPDSISSEWVDVELAVGRKYEKKIIPLVVRTLDRASTTQLNIQYVLDNIQYLDFTGDYDPVFERLKNALPTLQVGVAGHCQKIRAELASRPWGMDHYIQSEAKLLPIDAVPYEDGAIKGQPENLISRMHQSRRLMVLGEPGMGKTVALERLAWELANDASLTVPVFISLFEYDGQPLLKWIYLNLCRHGEIELDSPDETRRFLRAKEPPFNCYFLLDGLNEVKPKHHERALSEIRELEKDYSRHRLVVTSRVQDDGWRALRQGQSLYNTYLVQPIRPHQAQVYLSAHLGDHDGPQLWHQLDERMRELTTTPLLLWLIKEAWLEARERQGTKPFRIPENRGKLYQSFVNRMFRRDDERQLTQKVRQSTRTTALETIAYAMHEAKSLTISYEDALELVQNEIVLETLLINGLLLEVNERLRFAPHQTLQDLFAAGALKRKLDLTDLTQATGSRRSTLFQYADDPWWAETFIQLAGLADDPNVLARAIAEINPWLAWWCVQEGRKVDDTTRDAIRAESEGLVFSSRVQDRRRAAEALARMQTGRIVEPLLQLAADEDEETGQAAILSLKSLGDAAAEPLVRKLDDPTVVPKGRLRIGLALADIGDPRPGVLAPDSVPDFLWCEVPAGPFQMGGDPRVYSAWGGAEFILDYAFWIAKYPVTYAQYHVFVADGGYQNRNYWTEAGWAYKGDRVKPNSWNDRQWYIANHPVIGVTWYEAYAYTRWLNEKSGIKPADAPGHFVIRLIRECEWEKAARYPDGRLFPWGNDWNPTRLNWSESGIRRTSAVGMFPHGANPGNGACDLSGNVWEWCLTAWGGDYTSPEAEQNDPAGGAARGLRGGSWRDRQYAARTASRNGGLPWFSYFDRGFRVVCSVPIE